MFLRTRHQQFCDSLIELRRAHDSNGLRQHHLVGAVCVEVDAGQEGRLCGVSLGNTVDRLQFNWFSVHKHKLYVSLEK